jgi:hypothetical protein
MVCNKTNKPHGFGRITTPEFNNYKKTILDES